MAKILYLYAQPFRAGSDHARRTLQMLSLLKQIGHEVDLLTLPGGDPWPEGLVRKCYFTSRVPFVKGLPFYGRGIRRTWAGTVMLFASLRVAFCEHYDAIHCSDRAIRTGGFLSWLFRKPFIFEWHATHSGHDLVKWLTHRSRKFRRAIHMVFSDFPYPFSRLRQIGVYGRIATIPLLPSSQVTPQALPSIRTGGIEQTFRLVALSSTPNLQDLTALCKVLPPLLQQTELHVSMIGGSGQATERFRRRLHASLGDLAIRVAVRPLPPQIKDLLRMTEGADLVYLSAVSGPLPPARLVDLMAARTALLAIQCPAYSGLLSSSNASLVTYHAQAIGEAILRYMRSPTLCAEHAQAAYDTLLHERHPRNIAEEVRKCYDLALKEVNT